MIPNHVQDVNKLLRGKRLNALHELMIIMYSATYGLEWAAQAIERLHKIETDKKRAGGEERET